MRILLFMVFFASIWIHFEPARSAGPSIGNFTQADTFNGRPINAALARDLAGNRNLVAWRNCSLKLASNGSAYYPGANTQTAEIPNERRIAPLAAEDIPCILIVTGGGTTLNEYHVFETPCPTAISGSRHACIGGHMVGQRIKTTVGDVPDEVSFDLELVQEFKVPALSGRRPNVGATIGDGLQTVGDGLRSVGTARSKYAFGRTGSYSVHQAFNAEGDPIGDAFSVSTLTPVAYSDSGGSEQAVGECVQQAVGGLLASFDTQLVAAKLVYNYFNTMGALGAGTITAALMMDPKGFPMASGTVITLATLSNAGMDVLHGTRQDLLRAAAEQYCEKFGITEVPGTPPENPRLPDVPLPPSKSPPAAPPSENAQWVCVRWRETTGTYYENEADAESEENPIGQDVEVECLEHAWVEL